MNAIQKINQLNRQELDNNVLDRGSWHYERRDTNYIYIGGIPPELKEYDVLVIFSQYGVPTHINLIKNEETGDLKGFGYLKYADFRSCVLAIDNLNGVKLLDRNYLRVDHANYRLPRGRTEDDFKIDYTQYVDTKKTESSKMIKLFAENEGNARYDDLKNEQELRDPLEDIKQTVSEVQNPVLDMIQDQTDMQDPLIDMKQQEDDLLDPMAKFLDKAKKESKKRSHHERSSSSRKKAKDADKRAEMFLADIFSKSKKDP